jgi:hypothetical protein
MNNDYTINIIVHDLELAKPVQESLHPLPVNIFNGAGYPSFSKLCNDVIINNPTEIVIIASYKVRPTPKDIENMLNLINFGYGLVATYRFAFFGFKKELIRRIGFFDERFITGGYEDCDFMRRIIENNISIYENEEVIYYFNKSTWDNTISRIHFLKKWLEPEDYRIVRLLDDEKYEYDIGISNTNITFLDASHSIVGDGSKKWLKINIEYLKNKKNN